jgi:endonuclease/exonuclease/phosphatase family metal-dependent hydrolase
MTFNIEWGGTHIDFSKVVEAIQSSRADVVGIQEAEGNLQRLAAELGWHYNLRNYVVSRFPLVEPPGADGRYVLVEVLPGKVVALANVHLPSDPYGPDEVRDGASAQDVLALERATRLPKITPYLGALTGLAEQGIPVFLSGDFNAPAHTDWTTDMVGVRPFLRYAIDWPVSGAVTAAGLRDSWRSVHPDPKTHPGLTWWAGRPPLQSYAPGEHDAQDRIDFIWYAGPATVLSSEIVGERDGPEVAIEVHPWPSDHRAVVSGFSTEPAAMPALVSTERRIYALDEVVVIIFHGADINSIQVSKFAKTGGLLPTAAVPMNAGGRLQLPARTLSPGHYSVRAEFPDGPAMESEFWVLDPSIRPSIAVDGETYSVGQAIPVSWQNAPGNRNDYVAAVSVTTEAQALQTLAWSYVNARPDGRLVLDASSSEWGWPLTPGQYVMRLFKDDGYEVLAESSVFEVQ